MMKKTTAMALLVLVILACRKATPEELAGMNSKPAGEMQTRPTLTAEPEPTPTSTPVSPAPTPPITGTIAGEWYCREQPEINSPVVQTLHDGDPVTITGAQDGWLYLHDRGCWVVQAAVE